MPATLWQDNRIRGRVVAKVGVRTLILIKAGV
jgi:hypothetical protein